MKVFVTGGTGFVGSHLVEGLAADGHEVSLLVRSLDKLATRFPERTPRAIRGDLFDEAALQEAAGGADIIYHVAGATAARSRAEFFRLNEEGTRRVIDAARQAAPNLQRFVYVSTLAAVGPSGRGAPLDERAQPRPVSWYGESKLAGEMLTRASGLPWTVVRPSSVYGPHDTEFLRLFRMARRGFAALPGDPAQELSLVSVHDLTAALIAVLDPAAQGRTYFAAHPEHLTAEQLVRGIHAAVRASAGAPERLVVVPIPGVVARAALMVIGAVAGLAGRATLLSGDKANELLAEAWTCRVDALMQEVGWTPRHDHPRALVATARWYRERGWL